MQYTRHPNSNCTTSSEPHIGSYTYHMYHTKEQLCSLLFNLRHPRDFKLNHIPKGNLVYLYILDCIVGYVGMFCVSVEAARVAATLAKKLGIMSPYISDY